MCTLTMSNISSTEVRTWKRRFRFQRVFSTLLCMMYDGRGYSWWSQTESWLWLGWLKNCVALKREEQQQLVSVSEWPDKPHQVPFKVNKDYLKLFKPTFLLLFVSHGTQNPVTYVKVCCLTPPPVVVDSALFLPSHSTSLKLSGSLH